jgi:hypothetical protein
VTIDPEMTAEETVGAGTYLFQVERTVRWGRCVRNHIGRLEHSFR